MCVYECVHKYMCVNMCYMSVYVSMYMSVCMSVSICVKIKDSLQRSPYTVCLRDQTQVIRLGGRSLCPESS